MMMMMKASVYFQHLLFVVVVIPCLTRAQYQVGDESEYFSYNEDSEFGPSHWGDLRPEWRDCKYGNRQSPICLLSDEAEVVSDLGPIRKAYAPSHATLTNRGHDILLSWVTGAGHIQIYGTKYELKQCHWHSPSEHTIDGKKFDLELHLVHQTPNNDTAVIGVLYNIGHPDSFLSMMEGDLEVVKDMVDVEQRVGIINPNAIKFNGDGEYYRYHGSLTTPACTQNVIWTIMAEVRTVSRKQLQLIRDAIHGDSKVNARPIQATNGRTVKLYRPIRIVEISENNMDGQQHLSNQFI